MPALVRIIQESCPNNTGILSACYRNLVRMLQECCPDVIRIIMKVKIVSDTDKERKVTGRELLYRNLLLYFAEPMMIIISAILIINTAISYMSSDATNFHRTILTVACIVYFPIFLAVLLNSVAKKGGLPHNTWTKTHLELEEKHEEIL